MRLEETLEQLAKQHNHLERAFKGATVLPPSQSHPATDSKGNADARSLPKLALPTAVLIAL